MTESSTPITDLLVTLLSQNVPGDAVVAAVRALEMATKGRRSPEEQRKYERERKARWRGGRSEKSPGQKTVHISSSNNESESLKKKESTRPDVPGTAGDDWPADYGDRFWNHFPKFRRAERAKVYAKLERLRRDGYRDHERKQRPLTWADLWAGLERYVASEPGEFANAPIVWLNKQGWLSEWNRKGGSNGSKNAGARAGGVDVVAAAAARRFGNGGRNGAAPPPTYPPSPPRRVDHDGAAEAGRGGPARDLDERAGPGGAVRG